MKGFAVFITSLFVTISVSTQTEVKADTIGTSAFDKFLDEIVIAAKKPGTVVKYDIPSINLALFASLTNCSILMNFHMLLTSRL